MSIAEAKSGTPDSPELSGADRKRLAKLIYEGWRDALRHTAIPWDRPRDRDLFEKLGYAVMQNAVEGIYALTATTGAVQRHLYMRLPRERDAATFTRKAVAELRSRWRRSIKRWSADRTITSKKTGVSFTLMPDAPDTLVIVSVPDFERADGAHMDVRGVPGDRRGRLPDVETLRPRGEEDPIAREIFIDWCLARVQREKAAYRAALEDMPLLAVQEHVLAHAEAERRGERLDLTDILTRAAAAQSAPAAPDAIARRQRRENLKRMRQLVDDEYASASPEHQEFVFLTLRALMAGVRTVGVVAKPVGVAVLVVAIAIGGTLAVSHVLQFNKLKAAIINTLERLVKRVWSRAELEESVRELERISDGGRTPAVVTSKDPVTGDATDVWWMPDGHYGRRTNVKNLAPHMADIMEQVRDYTPPLRIEGRYVPPQLSFWKIGPRDLGVIALPPQHVPHDTDLRRMSIEGGPVAKAAIPWTYHIETFGERVSYSIEPQIVRLGDTVLYQVITRAELVEAEAGEPTTHSIYAYFGRHVEGDPIAVGEKWQIEAVIRVDADGTITPISQVAHKFD